MTPQINLNGRFVLGQNRFGTVGLGHNRIAAQRKMDLEHTDSEIICVELCIKKKVNILVCNC